MLKTAKDKICTHNDLPKLDMLLQATKQSYLFSQCNEELHIVVYENDKAGGGGSDGGKPIRNIDINNPPRSE